MTSMEHREPTGASIGDGHDVETHGDVPESRKRAVSEEDTLEREAKRARSPCPLEVSSASWPIALSVAEHADRSGGHDRSSVSLGSTRVRDPQRGDAPLVAPVVSPRAGGRGR